MRAEGNSWTRPSPSSGSLRDRYVLGDVDVLRPQRVGAGGAVGDELHVDAGGLRLAAPVGVVALQGGADRAVDLGEGEGSGGVPGGVHLGPLVRGGGQHAQRRIGQPLGQQRVGVLRRDPYGVRALGRGGEGGVGQHPGLRGRLLRCGQRADHGCGVELRPVLEDGVLADRELPGPVAVALPGGGERGLRPTVAVEPGQSLDDGEPAQGDGVVAVRGHGLGGREGHGHLQPLVPAGAAGASGRGAGGGDGHEERGGGQGQCDAAGAGTGGGHGDDLI